MIMLRSTLFACTLPAVNISNAQLAPERLAPIHQHLYEVNAQWDAMEPAVFDDSRSVRFNSDVERIAEHLHRVRQHLADHTPEGLNAIERNHRSELLDALDTYSDRSIFPMNDIAAGRSPVFIDDLGNACAVGHLMIASGHAELAERISREMNLAFVKDIPIPEVVAWAGTNGFTIDELAWIQPTYDHMKHRDVGLVASLRTTHGDWLEVRGPASAEAAQKLRLLRKGPGGDKLLATLPMLSGVQVMEHDGHVFIGGMPPTTGSSAELYEWNGKSLVTHDPIPGRMGIGSLSMMNGTLHVLGYGLGEAQPQERYLTKAGEWKTPPTCAEPIHQEAE